jgi:hypothetical protein
MKRLSLLALLVVSGAALAGNCDSYYGTADSRVQPGVSQPQPMTMEQAMQTRINLPDNGYAKIWSLDCDHRMTADFTGFNYVGADSKPSDYVSLNIIYKGHSQWEMDNSLFNESDNSPDNYKLNTFDIDGGVIQQIKFPHVWGFGNVSFYYHNAGEGMPYKAVITGYVPAKDGKSWQDGKAICTVKDAHA